MDILHGWESTDSLEIMSSRRKGLSLEWFLANQIRIVRILLTEAENIEYLVLQRIWSYKEKIFDKRRSKMSDKMRNILTHANHE